MAAVKTSRVTTSAAFQAVEGLIEIETRFEQLQLEARQSDSLGPALACITNFLRSKGKIAGGDINCAEAACRVVKQNELPELQELWQEIFLESQCREHNVLSNDAVLQTSPCSMRDMAVCTQDSESGLPLVSFSGKDMDSRKEDCWSPLRPDHLEALAHLESMREAKERFEQQAMERGDQLACLEVELQEVAASLKASELDSELLREERDVVSDELAVLQASIVRLERDKLASHADVEETSNESLIEILDLVDLIRRDAPWIEHHALVDVQEPDRWRGKATLRTLVQALLQESSQTRHRATVLDRTRFDSLLAESEEMASFLTNQGPAGGFVEADLKEVAILQADLAEASSRVQDSAQQILAEWHRVQARECSHLLKRRQRSLQLLSMRLDGSTAPRHKLKALRSIIATLLRTDQGRLHSEEYDAGSCRSDSMQVSPKPSYQHSQTCTVRSASGVALRQQQRPSSQASSSVQYSRLPARKALAKKAEAFADSRARASKR